MKRKTIWLIDAICMTVCSISAFISAILPKYHTWFRITEGVLCVCFVVMAVCWWIKFFRAGNNNCTTLENQNRPMSEEQFADIELILRSLRTEDLADEDEFIVVDFETKYEGLLYIQAMCVESFKSFRVEIAFEREENSFPGIYAKDDVPIDETVNIFKQVCCSTEKPDLKDWKDVTEKVLQAMNNDDE